MKNNYEIPIYQHYISEYSETNENYIVPRNISDLYQSLVADLYQSLIADLYQYNRFINIYLVPG